MYLNSFNLEEKISYNENVEPKTLIEDGDRRIILFALDKEQEILPHFSPVHIAIYVLKGKISVTVENNVYKIREGEMFMIPEKKEHSVIIST